MIINKGPIQKAPPVKINGIHKLANMDKLAIEGLLEISIAFRAGFAWYKKQRWQASGFGLLASLAVIPAG